MFEIDRQKFGSFLSEQRKAKGMTQKELAAQLYVTDKAVSKWENGGGLPDITLLAPLAEALGVTVAELLACQRLSETVTPKQANDLVEAAISLNELRERPNRKQGTGFAVWMMAVIAECAALWLMGYQNIVADETVLALMGICAGYAVYFWFFAPKTLPSYYDQNRIGAYSDGPLRMNVPGMRFTNGNWPHIVKTLRHSLFMVMAACPLVSLAGFWMGGMAGNIAAKGLLLIAVLAGILVPFYVIGKKYE